MSATTTPHPENVAGKQAYSGPCYNHETEVSRAGEKQTGDRKQDFHLLKCMIAPGRARPGRVARMVFPAAFITAYLAACAVLPSHANVVISQVYGGGGSGTAGPPYRNDYIELFNNGAATVSLTGWSVQYGSASGTSAWLVSNLTGSVGPGHYFLVQENAGTTYGSVLPTPDASGTLSMSASNGKVALVNSTAALNGANPSGPSIVDLVGYGTANGYEGVAAPALTNTTALLRADQGCSDTNNNSLDFTVGTPSPRNSASPTHSCGAVAPPNLVFSTNPSSAVAGATFAIQPTVTAQLADATTDTTFTGAVTLLIKPGTGPSGAVLAGTVTANAVAGVATFSGLSIAKAGSGFVLTASASAANPADSAAFDVSTGPPSQLAFMIPPTAASAGASITPAPLVAAYDSQGNATPSFAGTVTVTLNGGTAGATLLGTTSVPATNGTVAFADLSVNVAGDAYTLTAAADGMASATSSPFNIGSGQPASISFSTQPGTATAGSPLVPQPVVTLLDAAGNASSFNGAVTIALKPATGTPGAVLGGAASVSAVNGIATFAGLTVDRAGTNYVLTATGASLTVDSGPFTITAAPAPVGYSIVDLGVLPVSESGSTAFKVNNKGQVAGWSGHPFLWADGALTDLNTTLGANIFSYSPARALNDDGVVVGSYNAWVTVATFGSADFKAFSAVHAFKWVNGVFTDLTPAAPTGTLAVAINKAGDVALSGLAPSILRANGTNTPLNGIVSGSALNPTDINDAGIVVGDAVTTDSYTHAAMWQNGTATDLGALPGDFNSSAKAVSPLGVIVGDSYGPTSTDANTHACLWSRGSISQLPPRSIGESCVATGVNSYGDVAGYVGSDLANGAAAGALVWDGGAVHDLQTLIPSGEGWQLSAARSINDLGQIVGYGWHNNVPRAFLLTPTAVFGDANNDGSVTFADAAIVASMAAGAAPAKNLMFLDVAPATSSAPRGFGDGKLDLLDAVRILRKASSLETRWP